MDKYLSILRQEIQFLTYADLPESHLVVQASYQRIIDARTDLVKGDVAKPIVVMDSQQQLIH
jgi:hypothetical protein